MTPWLAVIGEDYIEKAFLLWDRDGRPKPAFDAILDVLLSAGRRR